MSTSIEDIFPLKNQNQFQAVLALYGATQNEISRYKDQEWKNLTLFTAAIIVIIGFIVANQETAQEYRYLFDFALILLAAGNIFYSSLAHDRLTFNRNLAKQIEYMFNLRELKQSDNALLPFSFLHKPLQTCEFRKGWSKGLYTHLIPFFLADIALAIFGIINCSQVISKVMP